MISRLLIVGAVALSFVSIGASKSFETAPIATISAPSLSDQWLTRTNSSYQLLRNDTNSVVVVNDWLIDSVNEKLQSGVSEDRFERDTKALQRWYWHLFHQSNSTGFAFKHHDQEFKHDSKSHHHDKKHHKFRLNAFYLRHAQCRACVANNMNLLFSTSVPTISDDQPVRMMKWCSLTTPRLKNEQSPLLTGAPLSDFEGYCIEADQSCPSDAIDMNILDQSTCANDEPATKQSCALCVNDGFWWSTSFWSVRRMDSYDGQCVDPADVAASAMEYNPHRLTITELKSCPGFAHAQRHHKHNDNDNDDFGANSFGALMFTMIFPLLLVLCCLGCMRARAKRRFARLAAESNSSVSMPVAMPVVASAPPASDNYAQPQHDSSVYPAQMAARNENAAPLLSSAPQFYPPAYLAPHHVQYGQQPGMPSNMYQYQQQQQPYYRL